MNENENENKSVKNGPGRPRYNPKYPNTKKGWTFRQWCSANGVDPETLRGEHCVGLTLRKFLIRDKPRKNKSQVVLLKGYFGKPEGENGLGKPPSLYCLREKMAETIAALGPIPDAKSKGKKPLTKVTKVTKVRKSKVTMPLAPVTVNAVSPETEDYEAQKAALLNTDPAPIVAETVPVMDIPATEEVATTTEEVAALV